MSRILVSYFSARGTTKKVAEKLAKAIDADIYEIKPASKYTTADLNWTNKFSRSSIEMGDKTIRPVLADKNPDISKYDIIFLGFPIWWYVAPTIINTYLESLKNAETSNKRIILFATSGGSGFGNTLKELIPSAPEFVTLEEGSVLNGSYDILQLKSWAEKFI